MKYKINELPRNPRKLKTTKEKKITKKEFAEQWLLADKEINEWIKFKCVLFALYEKQKTKTTK